MFKRFRDSVTGLFVSSTDAKARPRETEEETTSRASVRELRMRRVLIDALRADDQEMDHVTSARLLRKAIQKALNPELDHEPQKWQTPTL
jgi:hypothetical protein